MTGSTVEYAIKFPDGHVEALYRRFDDDRTPKLPGHAREAGARLVWREVIRTPWAEVGR